MNGSFYRDNIQIFGIILSNNKIKNKINNLIKSIYKYNNFGDNK